MVGLSSDDARPVGIALQDAYAAVRGWYQANVARLATDPTRGIHAAAAKTFVASMPAPQNASREEVIDTFRRVIAGDLEWAYHESDGQYKMAAYAWAACDAAGIDPSAVSATRGPSPGPPGAAESP